MYVCMYVINNIRRAKLSLSSRKLHLVYSRVVTLNRLGVCNTIRSRKAIAHSLAEPLLKAIYITRQQRAWKKEKEKEERRLLTVKKKGWNSTL